MADHERITDRAEIQRHEISRGENTFMGPSNNCTLNHSTVDGRHLIINSSKTLRDKTRGIPFYSLSP